MLKQNENSYNNNNNVWKKNQKSFHVRMIRFDFVECWKPLFHCNYSKSYTFLYFLLFLVSSNVIPFNLFAFYFIAWEHENENRILQSNDYYYHHSNEFHFFIIWISERQKKMHLTGSIVTRWAFIKRDDYFMMENVNEMRTNQNIKEYSYR